MRKCIRCNVEMLEDYDVKVEGAAYGLKITKPGIFKDKINFIDYLSILYCSSVTASSHSFEPSFPGTSMAR